MIFHFIKRDFVDFRLGWLLITIITVLAAFASFWNPAGLLSIFILFFVYYVFANLPTGDILGSTWRTQTQLSRHYLLSLPFPHMKLFRIQQIRMLIFWIPFLGLGGVLPAMLYMVPEFPPMTAEMWVLYYFGLFVSVGIFLHMNMWMGLEIERVSAYLPRGERLRANIKLFGVMIGIVLMIAYAWQDLFYSVFAVFWPELPWSRRLFGYNVKLARWIFPGMFVVLLFFARYNARRWCVTMTS